MLLLIRNILFSRNIILLQSYLQILNYKELIFKNKILGKNLKDAIILSHHIKDSYFLKTKRLLKKLNINNISIQCTKSYQVKLIYLLIKIRKLFFKNLDLVIIGNFNSYLDKEFYNISDNAIVLDDGTNIFDKKISELKKINCTIFSLFEKKFFNKKNYIKNNFLFLKKKLKLFKKKSKDIYLVGAPYVEIFSMKRKYYNNLIRKTVSHLNTKKVFYLPHPKENLIELKKQNLDCIKIIETSFPVELYILNKKNYPKLLASYGSTALITLKKISKKLQLINMIPNFPNSTKVNHKRIYKFNRYIKKIGIKSKKISIL